MWRTAWSWIVEPETARASYRVVRCATCGNRVRPGRPEPERCQAMGGALPESLARSCGAVKSCIGPSGTMPVGFTEGWLS
ncbi:hypothetical protein SAMN05192564_106208 [Paraburkholderia sartisoli]|uniref:Uncharacterized protein n=1 Tax=Paraburkholderia sartisoli TaxID=83784 RepID=A0A1H4GRP2_9BURK|nr:hypothetical protein SAMN05192564_106208 [Paraburkholderia sartisoli]